MEINNLENSKDGKQESNSEIAKQYVKKKEPSKNKSESSLEKKMPVLAKITKKKESSVSVPRKEQGNKELFFLIKIILMS